MRVVKDRKWEETYDQKHLGGLRDLRIGIYESSKCELTPQYNS